VGAAALFVPLASSLALTGSRAGVAALLVGGVVAILVTDVRRSTASSWAWALIVPTCAFLLVSSSGLTDSGVVGDEADRLGNRTLASIVGLTVLTVVSALVAPRSASSARVARRVPIVVPLVAAALLAGGLARWGPDLAGDRPTYWRVAIDGFGNHPVLGSGAGTFARVWLQERPVDASVRDAHSIVVEALSELGVVGLAVVIALLVVPLAWAIRIRGSGLAPAAAGAYAAFAAHACVDWDWELPAVTLAGLFCGVALGSLADNESPVGSLRPTSRMCTAALGAAAATVALAMFLGASAVEDASRALARGDPGAAEHAARRAERWQPWSVEPLLMRGRARLLAGDLFMAQVQFLRATHRDPGDYRAWLALAGVSEGEPAKEAVQRATELNPFAVSSLSAS
jgi:O-Antigen ligase